MKIRLLAAVAVLTLTATGAEAAPVGPPYDQARFESECGEFFGAASLVTCELAGGADRLTGAFDSTATMTTRGQGYLPGAGYGSAGPTMSDTYALSGSPSSATFDVSIHIDSAQITQVRRLGGLAPAPVAEIYAYVETTLPDCSCAFNGTYAGIADSFQPSVGNRLVTARVTLQAWEGETLPDGDVKVTMSIVTTLNAYAPAFGSVTASVSGAILGYQRVS